MDMEKTYFNLLTSRTVAGGRIPLIMDNDFDALRAGIKTAPDVDYENLRIVRIKNTLDIEVLEISDALVKEAEAMDSVVSVSEGHFWQFDDDGNLLCFGKRDSNI